MYSNDFKLIFFLYQKESQKDKKHVQAHCCIQLNHIFYFLNWIYLLFIVPFTVFEFPTS